MAAAATQNSTAASAGAASDAAPIAVSIDIGTSGSAIAIGIRSTQHISVISPLPEPRTAGAALKSPPEWRTDKVPTVALLDSKTLALVAFGEESYRRYATEGYGTDGLPTGRLLLFDHIKMRLEGSTNGAVTRATKLAARCGTLVPIGTVLKEILTHCRHTATARLSTELPIKWTVTVPTSWSGAAQQLMLEAAHAAGMTNAQIAFESEAAAVAVNHWAMRQPLSHHLILVPGSSCGVIDLGGGTCDVTCHSIDAKTGALTEARHSGGSWAGNKVDQAFHTVLDQTFGGDWMRMWEDRFPADARTLDRSLELMKREISLDAKEYRLPLPTSFIVSSGLGQLVPSKNSLIVLDTQADPHGTRGRRAPADAPMAVDVKAPQTASMETQFLISATQQLTLDDGDWEAVLKRSKKLTVRAGVATAPSADEKRLSYQNGYLKWSAALAQSTFASTLAQIERYVQPLVEDPRLSTIFLVGGFSASPMIRALVQRVVNKANAAKASGAKGRPAILLVYPSDPIQSVLVGATLYALNPQSVRSRVMRHTVACDRAKHWDGAQHQIVPNACDKTWEVRFDAATGKPHKYAMCHGHLDALVKAGDIVTVGDHVTQSCYPAHAGQTEMELRFFTSPAATVNRVDDKDVEFMGRLLIPMPVGDGGLTRRVEYSISFAGTHVSVNARDVSSGVPVAALFTFLD